MGVVKGCQVIEVRRLALLSDHLARSTTFTSRCRRSLSFPCAGYYPALGVPILLGDSAEIALSQQSLQLIDLLFGDEQSIVSKNKV